MEQFKTANIACTGGLITSSDVLELGQSIPGAAVALQNFEPHPAGGYRRMQGFSKYDTAAVPGTGDILGVCVMGLIGSVLAQRGVDVYQSAGLGWTKVNGANARTAGSFTRFVRYGYMGNERYVLVNGLDQPAYYNPQGPTYALATNAPSGATCAFEYAGRMFYGKNNLLTFTAPFAENDFTAGAGGGQVNVGSPITGLAVWRNQLMVFCTNKIFKFAGTGLTDFALAPVTANLGCPWPETIAELNGDLIFLAPDGLRNIAGTQNQGDTQLSTISKQVQTEMTAVPRMYSRVTACTIRRKSQYRMLTGSSGVDAAATLGFMGVLRGAGITTQDAGWEYAQAKGIKAYCCDSWSTPTGDRELAVFANDTGFVYTMESGNNFDGQVIQAIYETPAYTFDDLNLRKVFRKLNVFLSAEAGVSLKVNLVLDQSLNQVMQPLQEDLSAGGSTTFLFGYPASKYGVATFGSAPIPRVDTNLIGSGFTGALRFTSDEACPPFSIKSFALMLSVGGKK